MANEPRVRDVRLGEVLGFSQARLVRRVIKANLDELLMHGPSCQVSTMVGIGSGAQREVAEYYLNEAQALLVCMFARTEKAAEIRKQVIEVFLAWRRGELAQASAAPDPTVTILRRLEERLTAMEKAGRQLSELIIAPVESALSLTHVVELWFDQSRQRRPKFWGDVEVRGFLLATHRQATVDQVRDRCAEAFGQARTPTRSAIHRFWQRLDRLKAANPSLRMH
ncbi:hypothetical protein [Caulobacter segnis]|uniref:Uncharacterized protein n=1 Tax=Caulobacter segnis TaxID=88688 RepID=A0A2W5W9U1_9CAUL|nr:hypothetical protein [Caulobacter segnis]PZR30318.1 MAG: hypothetical protein DI526_22780 [Caulobacter segnis]